LKKLRTLNGLPTVKEKKFEGIPANPEIKSDD
jgi:hypothetical protein